MKTFNRINTVCLLLLVVSTPSLAWEVNTHRAIDRCALTTECGGQNKARSLHAFAADAGITDESYEYEVFEEYGPTTYFDYILTGEGGLLWGKGGISAWNQSFSSYGYQSLIEAGTILEDSQAPDTYHEWYDTSLWEAAYGRYNNHYADAQNGWKGLTYGVSDTDAITWAESWATNRYNYTSALEYYKKGFTESDEDQRRKYRAKMLVSVGFLLHMLNDMNVPAHMRDDSHPEGDIFEKWMRGGDSGKNAGGFKIIGSVLDPNVDRDILSAVSGAVPFKYSSSSSFRKFYENEGLFTGVNFYSKDTISVSFGLAQKYFSYRPTISEVNLYTGDSVGFVTSNSPDLLTGHKKLAMVHATKIWNKYGDQVSTDYKYGMRFNNDNSVYIDNGINLIPRAVANAEGFINYFFRGRTKASMTGNTLSIKNISDPSLVASPQTVTFKSGGTFWIYYETYKRVAKYLHYINLPNDLTVGESVSIDLSPYLNTSVQADSGETLKLTVLFEGDIGAEKGLSVAIAKKLTNDAKLYSAKITLKNYDQTLKTWNNGVQTGEGFSFWEGPVSFSEEGKYHVYSGIWDQGEPGTNWGGNIMVEIDSDTNRVIDFSAQNIATWDCGPDIGQVTGRDESIEGPKPGKEIYRVYNTSGIYSVSGISVCSDYITNMDFKWGCPGFDDVLISYSCNDSTYLKIEIW